VYHPCATHETAATFSPSAAAVLIVASVAQSVLNPVNAIGILLDWPNYQMYVAQMEVR
jgi:hypothetical protein